MRVFSVCVCAAMFFATPAFASHYDLIDVELVDAAMTQQLMAATQKLMNDGIVNTEDLLARLLTKSDRAEFSKKYGISPAHVEELSKTLELMQIVGVGPKAAKLLQLAGVESVAVLSKADATVLLTALLNANREHVITGVQPDLIVVRDWIEKSKKIVHHLK